MEMVVVTLEKMARGGIYDQIGGGFHRYATDSFWLTPHFEKMLYDNALLSRVYLNAYLVTGNQLFHTVARETIDYVVREMTAPQGAFYSTQDADSEGFEGKYYLWTLQEIIEVMGKEEGRIVADYFGVTAGSNFDGQSILHVVKEPGAELSNIVEEAKTSLLKSRERRVSPGRDEKSLASWNGLMLASLSEAACALGRRDYLAVAAENGAFLLNSMVRDELLQHTYANGSSKLDGYLDDYAAVIEGFLTLHQATLRGEWLRQAIALARVMITQFWDEAGGVFYDTCERHEGLFVRPKSTFDSAVPSGVSMATLVLLKLNRLVDNDEFEHIAVKALGSVRELMSQYPLGFSNWLCALDFYLSEPREIAVIGSMDDPATSELLHTLCTMWLPNKVVAACDPDNPTAISGLKLLEGRGMIDNKPTVYICHRYSCQAPVTDPVSLAAQLSGD
ncbi:thioredoxin domain-containing protein [Chloroflexota bacterium]